MARPALSATSQRLRIVAAVPALIGIFFFGQSLLDARKLRLDLTPERRYTLSDHAAKVLDGLPADVRILAFLRSQDPRNPFIRDLLGRFAARSARGRVETVDVNRSPALARQYGVGSYGALVVESGGRRRQFSSPNEDVLVAALLQVTRQQRKIIAVSAGHGEGELTNPDRREGLSTLRTVLEHEYYDVRPVMLLADEVSPETAVLVIPGPQKDFLAGELAALDRYLQRPGNALILLDPLRAPELAKFLARYYVGLGNDVVVDPGARLYGGEYLTMQVGFAREDHPILVPLDAAPLFSATRSVEVLPGEAGTMVGIPFLRSGNESWATMDSAPLRSGTASFVPGRDRRGPISVGAEVTFRTLTPPGGEPREGRLVVYGNAQFANNFFIEFLGNKDLLTNTVNWLASDREAISQRPHRQEFGRQQFVVSEEQGDAAFWGTVVAWPGLFAAVGLALALRRRWGPP